MDYSVYLVTDSTPAILGQRDLASVVESSVRGGASIVQYRDKTCSRDDAIRTARAIHAVTKRHGVPLLINDRVDVAAEVGCEGVHIGQEDMNITQARQLLGKGKIIGVTASSVDEALSACTAGADYLGIGTVFATSTKKDTKSIIGPSGVREILSRMQDAGYGDVPTVCIGGINASNAAEVLAGAASPGKPLDGVAVVSALVAAQDPAAVARDLLSKVALSKIPDVIATVARKTPLSHNMTNLVVQNFAANVALAVGASPIMANYAEEAADLAKLGGALVVNMGTVTPAGLASYVQALKAYNAVGGPTLLDPVGAGATGVRRAAVKTILSSGTFTVIKGNQSEIQTVAGATIAQRGVDGSSSLGVDDRAALVARVARERRCVVLMTGPTDLLSDGRRTLRVDNGHEILGRITGTGCTLGTTVSAMIAAYRKDPLLAATAGVVLFSVAAQIAIQRPEVRGPGTFVPAFLDELNAIRDATAKGDLQWLNLAKVAAVEVPLE